MNNPDYRLGWTPERRRAASEAAKRRWADRKAAQEAERQKERRGARFLLQQVRGTKAREMTEIASRWHRLKAEVAEIDTALALIEQIAPVLRKYRIGQDSPNG